MCNSSILGNPAADGILRNATITVQLKYLSNFFMSLEMPLINCKIHLELNWSKTCAMPTVDDNDNKTTFQITSTKLHVPR